MQIDLIKKFDLFPGRLIKVLENLKIISIPSDKNNQRNFEILNIKKQSYMMYLSCEQQKIPLLDYSKASIKEKNTTITVHKLLYENKIIQIYDSAMRRHIGYKRLK